MPDKKPKPSATQIAHRVAELMGRESSLRRGQAYWYAADEFLDFSTWEMDKIIDPYHNDELVPLFIADLIKRGVITDA